ncbi:MULTISPECIES: flagellar motor stator protein MotA [Methylocystis]|uniref:Flagellar motor protein MotA n=1 Tax=Methylocystis iwaonis TaxID=2885079 RepID=A0ABN6VCR5_9HYPH|nr:MULTISPECIES: flagellar motor stator protein MotA [Methylocystis]MBL1258630.1 flagellar motor stator protein MotA [Methylocystis sp. Sn-Cys]MDJ0449424.1 flagellar motor stator protein MotA [Methylocystis sp. JR02]BDV33034.1 flagellar motor protein MotA [Methylocystis iwaonis]
MGFLLGLVVTMGCMLGGFAALGGHLIVLWQPWEFVIILGSALGTFIVANPTKVILDTGKSIAQAVLDRVPKRRDYLDVLGLLHALLREIRSKARNEVELHIDAPSESAIFNAFPGVLKNQEMTAFICDYCRLYIIGNVRTFEIENLMDEEISSIKYDRLKPYHALSAVGDGLPALGIVAAVLGVIKAMGALDQSPELLGGLIGAAMVGTFAGIFVSYGIVTPLAFKVKVARTKECHVYLIVKQTLLAFMNGALPQVAIEHGRKSIPSHDRPSIDEVESEAMNGAAKGAA